MAVLGPDEGRSIALIDLTDPAQARVKKTLRATDGKPSVTPAYPVFSAGARRCFFVNANPKGMSLYSVEPGEAARPRRVERDGFDKFIAELASSPGRPVPDLLQRLGPSGSRRESARRPIRSPRIISLTCRADSGYLCRRARPIVAASGARGGGPCWTVRRGRVERVEGSSAPVGRPPGPAPADGRAGAGGTRIGRRRGLRERVVAIYAREAEGYAIYRDAGRAEKAGAPAGAGLRLDQPDPGRRAGWRRLRLDLPGPGRRSWGRSSRSPARAGGRSTTNSSRWPRPCSTSTGPGPSRRGRSPWSPRVPGVTPRPIPDAPAPARSPAQRLAQMSDLARDFSGTTQDREERRWELRLLPKPLYRYESTDPDVLDGAVFAFVSSAGTDPEAILVLEARKAPGEAAPSWHYAVGPLHRPGPPDAAQGPRDPLGPVPLGEQPRGPLPRPRRPDHPAGRGRASRPPDLEGRPMKIRPYHVYGLLLPLLAVPAWRLRERPRREFAARRTGVGPGWASLARLTPEELERGVAHRYRALARELGGARDVGYFSEKDRADLWASSSSPGRSRPDRALLHGPIDPGARPPAIRRAPRPDRDRLRHPGAGPRGARTARAWS